VGAETGQQHDHARVCCRRDVEPRAKLAAQRFCQAQRFGNEQPQGRTAGFGRRRHARQPRPAGNRIAQRAGIKGGSSHSGRRTFAGKVLATTGDMVTVAQLLGHSSTDCSQRYGDLVQGTLQAMFADAA